VSSLSRSDDGGEAAGRQTDREEFRRLVRADRLLSRLAARSFPDLPLRSTLLLCLLTVVLAMLLQDVVLAAVLGVVLLGGQAWVVHLLARSDQQGPRLLLRLLRAGCATASVVLAVAAVVSPPASSAPPPAPVIPLDSARPGMHGKVSTPIVP
jgi:hypothetical protein